MKNEGKVEDEESLRGDGTFWTEQSALSAGVGPGGGPHPSFRDRSFGSN